MLSTISPYIFSITEDIPSIDIFAPSDYISATGQSRPKENATSASLEAGSIGQADACRGLDADQCGGRRARKATACETDLELSLESSTEENKDRPRKKSLLEGLEPKGALFDEILIEEDSFEQKSGQFLGKRDITHFEDDNEMDYPQLKKRSSIDCTLRTKPQPFNSASSCPEPRKFCSLGHRLGMSSITTGDCCLCRSVLSTLQRFVLEKGGALVSTTLSSEVTLRCANNHEWSVCYKKATKSWCKECKSKRKQLLKEMLEEENQRIYNERKKKQERLFEEARQHVKTSNASINQENEAERNNLKIIFEEISRLASKYAREYCQKNPSAEYEQTLLLYQTLILPEKCLQSYFAAMTRPELKKEFRRCTILLHPDKNNHPKAKQAFQKAYELLSKNLETPNP